MLPSSHIGEYWCDIAIHGSSGFRKFCAQETISTLRFADMVKQIRMLERHDVGIPRAARCCVFKSAGRDQLCVVGVL